jgi:hypothetical protein
MIYPTKEQLEFDYYNLSMTQQQIAKKYGFKTRQPIGRLFKKYNIISKSKSQTAKDKDVSNNPIPPKEVIEKLYTKTNSVSELARILNVSRKRATNWIKYYDINITYFKNDICNKTLFKELHTMSIKEAAVKYNISTTKIKSRVPFVPKVEYNIERLKEIISLYDLNNQGFSKAITLDDENVYNSILEHTNNHFRFGDKITERVYRIINNFSPEKIISCKETGEPLKFYTMELGYGNSHLQLSKTGFVWADIFTSNFSKVSQNMFWEIYELLNDSYKKECYFSLLNNEFKVLITEQHSPYNKFNYSMDFLYKTKNIEFDGDYWHSLSWVKNKDKLRDEYLKSKGFEILRIQEKDYRNNKQETLNRCIKFLIE